MPPHQTQTEQSQQTPSDIVRAAMAALEAGNGEALGELLHDDFQWIFLDPSQEKPAPEPCPNPRQLVDRAIMPNGRVARSHIDEMIELGENVVVVSHVEGGDPDRVRPGNDNYHVVTVRDGRVARLRACLTREEALSAAAASAE